MNTYKSHTVLRTLIIGSAFFTATASASIQYNFTSSANSFSSGAEVSGHTFSATGSGPNAQVSGWSSSGAGATLESAQIFSWNGLGVDHDGCCNNNTDDHHSTDNAGTGDDAILISFAEDIELTGLSLGWWASDYDISVLAYTPDTTPTLVGETYSGMTSSGWEVIDHISDIQFSTNSTTGNKEASIDSNGTSSSYWIVSAYLGTGVVGQPLNWTRPRSLRGGNDYFKLSGVSGVPGQTPKPPPTTGVPEPSTILLLGLGLLAIWHYKRDNKHNHQEKQSLAC